MSLVATAISAIILPLGLFNSKPPLWPLAGQSLPLFRSGTKHTHPENDRIEWLKGNILDPTPLKDKINSADIIVHAIGTLFDTSVTQRAEPG